MSGGLFFTSYVHVAKMSPGPKYSNSLLRQRCILFLALTFCICSSVGFALGVRPLPGPPYCPSWNSSTSMMSPFRNLYLFLLTIPCVLTLISLSRYQQGFKCPVFLTFLSSHGTIDIDVIFIWPPCELADICRCQPFFFFHTFLNRCSYFLYRFAISFNCSGSNFRDS